MIKEANSFIKNIHNDMCGLELLKKYQWLKQLDIIINSNCNIIPNNFKYLLFTGYITALYNTILVHLLLSEVLPVSVIACVPIIASFMSGFIDPTQIVILGIFQFGQLFLTIIIFNNQISLSSNEDIQKTFIDFKDNQIISSVDYFSKVERGRCHVYSYPYKLKHLR